MRRRNSLPTVVLTFLLYGGLNLDFFLDGCLVCNAICFRICCGWRLGHKFGQMN